MHVQFAEEKHISHQRRWKNPLVSLTIKRDAIFPVNEGMFLSDITTPCHFFVGENTKK